MDNNTFKNTVSGLDDAGLDQLAQAVQSQREQRRQKFDINQINPNMTPEQRTQAGAEIARALKEAGLRI